MLISQEQWHVSPGIELIRSGDQVTFNLSGSAEGYYDPDLGYWEWYGYMELIFGEQYDYFEQYYDRPMDVSVTETLTAGVVTTGTFDIYGDPGAYQAFNVILFDVASNYTGAAGVDYVFGSDQNDSLSGAAGDDGLEGGLGDDVLNGGQGGDLLDGGDGRDIASYAGAAAGVVARLYDAAANDGDARGDRYVSIEVLEGSSFNDHLYGDAKANSLLGRNGVDTLLGLKGADTLAGGAGGDMLIGGDGADTAIYAGAAQGVTANLTTGVGSGGDAQGDTFSSIENLIGTGFDDALTGDAARNALTGGAGNDTLRGLDGDDRLVAGNGDDRLFGGSGADRLEGGYGTDTVSYAGASAGVQANLADPSANTRDAKGDVYVSIENLTGTSFNDRLTGNAGENVIIGGDGADVIGGGGGSDRLYGGAGADSFLFDSALDPLGNVDRIFDYSVAEDRFRLDDAVFGALGAGGTIGGAAFTTGSAATTAAHRIIYNDANGLILYDSDGTGAAEAIAFARIASGLAMTAGEFFVV